MGKAVSIALVAILSMSVFTYLDTFAFESKVRITGHRMSVDTAGVVHISGIVENASGSPIKLVRVTAQLFDENGTKLPTYDTYTLVRTIPSGFIAPFDIPISDKRVGSSVYSYTLSLEWKPAEIKENKFVFSDLKVFVWTHINPKTGEIRNPHGSGTSTHHGLLMSAHTEIDALVKNTGDRATRTVKIFAIWYDEKGQYYSYNMQTVAGQLVSSESSRFVIMTHPTMGYYSLVAESEDYVSMHIENGDYMFRVHEANAENRLLAGVDTMSISNLIVKDVENNMITNLPIKKKSVLPHIKPTSNKSTFVINDNEKEYQLQIQTYENNLIDLNYNKKTKTIKFMTDGSHTHDIIHVEIIIPNTFNEFLSAKSFKATVNGMLLDDRFFFVDPYSYKDKTAMHYIITGDGLKLLPKHVTGEHAGHFIFTLKPLVSSEAVSINVGESIQLQSTVTNNIDKKQKFVYIMQVKDSTGATVMISWIDGVIAGKESINAMLSWTPEKEGKYTMQAFLWESLTYPSSMSSNFADATFVVS